MISSSELLNAQILADVYGQSRMNPILSCTQPNVNPYQNYVYGTFPGLGYTQSASSILNNPYRVFGELSAGCGTPSSFDLAFAGMNNPVLDTMTSSVFQPQPISAFCRKSALEATPDVLQQGEQAHMAHDLLMDRRRDCRNLGLINDLIDARKLQQISTTGQHQPWLDLQVDETVKAIVRDAKYNRKADEIIGNLALGRPHVPHAFEKLEDFENIRFDMAARQMAKQIFRQSVVNRPVRQNIWGLVC